MVDARALPVPGERLPAFVRDAGFAHWNRYAAVNDEFVDIHMSDEAGQRAGYPTAIGMGNLTWAYFHVALHEWFGEEATVKSVGAQFRAAVTRGSLVRVRGRVTAVRSGRPAEIDVDIWAEDDAGERLAPGSATVCLP
jgi:hypothetical protein